MTERFGEAALPPFFVDVVSATENRGRIGALRHQSALARGPLGPVVLRYESVNGLIRDHRLIGPGMELARFAGIPEGCRTWALLEQVLNFMDGEQHQRLRRLVAKAFTGRTLERLRPVARSTMRHLVDEVEELGRADAARTLCEPFPGPVIGALLGVDREQQIVRWSDTLLLALRVDAGRHLAKIEACQGEVDEYLQQLIEQLRIRPRNDFLTELVHSQDDDKPTVSELQSIVSLLLIAGTRGVSNQLSNIIHTFAVQGRSWQKLRRRPELIPSAVDEAIRWEPASEGVFRIATEEIEVDGYSIPAGTLVLLSSISANQDVSTLAGGDRFDIERRAPDGWQPLTFGGGIHSCLGAALAKLELVEAVAELTERFPTLRLDGDPLPNPAGAANGRGYASLPIRWR